MTHEKGDLVLNIIDATFQNIEIDTETTFKNLTVFPLTSSSEVNRDYITLDEALDAGTARVTELSETGSVPELLFHNEGEQPVLLLDGEELVGAKQNRVLNLSILAPARKTITIPVSCVEQGRWAYRSDRFRSEKRVHFSRGRASKAASVSRSLFESGNRRSNQSEVWHSISNKSGRLGVSSATDSMSDIYEERAQSIEGFVEAFSASKKQIGAVFAIDGAVAGVDLFEAPDILSHLLPKLIRSYALDAIETSDENGKATSENELGRFIEIVLSVPLEEFPAVGLGTDVRLNSEMISGGGLVFETRVVHLAAFPITNGGHHHRRPRRAHMTRASQRRRTH
jgi:hypothetical protein